LHDALPIYHPGINIRANWRISHPLATELRRLLLKEATNSSQLGAFRKNDGMEDRSRRQIPAVVLNNIKKRFCRNFSAACRNYQSKTKQSVRLILQGVSFPNALKRKQSLILCAKCITIRSRTGTKNGPLLTPQKPFQNQK